MLDTYGRKYANPLILSLAKLFLKKGLKPNAITVLGFLIGVASAICLLIGYEALAVVLLWLSGLLDAVDGAMARESGKTSLWGAFMDICFDRIVEIGIILVLGWLYPDTRFVMMLLMAAILMSMTVFLTVGALSKEKKEKSFYYQAGLAERTEGFIFLTLMMLITTHLMLISYTFVLIIGITIIQRVYEAYGILRD